MKFRSGLAGIMFVLGSLLISLAPNGAAFAQSPPAAGQAESDDALGILRRDIDALSAAIDSSARDFKALLSLRSRADELIQRADVLARSLNGAPPLRSDDRPAPSGPETSKRPSEPAKAALYDAEVLRQRITDLRRRQMTGRLYAASVSPFSPSFWSDLATLTVSTTRDQMAELRNLWVEHAANELLLDTGMMGACVVLLLGLVVAARRLIQTRILGRLAINDSGTPDRRVLHLRALVSLVLSTLPIPLALGMLALIDRQIDFAPDELDPFFASVILVWAGLSLGSSTLRIALQPRHASLRLMALTDRQAAILFRAGHILMFVYGCAIALDELQRSLHFLVAITAATTMIWVALCAVCIGWALRALHAERGERMIATDNALATLSPGANALVVVPSHRDRVALSALALSGWSVAIISVLALLSGYLALAGFVMGRFIVTIVLWALAVLFLKAVDVLLTPHVKREPVLEPFLSRLSTPGTETSELAAVIAAGFLRVAIVLPMIFVTIGPWHLEYGEVNPFQDAFVGINLVELRDAIGAAGFAVICLAIGLAATKLITTWLEGSLLPYTRLDLGVRYSLTTIVSYGGVGLSIALALSQLGVSPQNLTVIASALSVGIGFGLQSIVSNFVSGLIILTERRVRVGDIVNVKGEEGRVKRINVRSTLIATGDNEDLIVPNTDLITTVVRNKTLTDSKIKVRMPLIVAHETNLQALFDAVMGAVYHHANVQLDPAPTISLTKPSPVGLEFEVAFLTVDDSKAATTKSELYLHWIELLRDQGIRLAQANPPPPSPK